MKQLKTIQKRILQVLTDLKFAISLFFLISFYGVCGSILEQERPAQYYIENYSVKKPFLNFLTSDLIFNFGLDHIFSTWWFYTLIFVFGLSLITCSFTRQIPLFLFSRGVRFFYSSNIPKNFQIFETLKPVKTSFLTNLLLEKNYLTIQKQGAIYSYKGLIGRFAPLLVHLSLIIVLAGTMVASLSSFSAQELIPKSELFNIQNTIRKGTFSQFPKYTIRVNDFWITYNEEENIKQYFSNISVLGINGTEKASQTISVNNPLQYKGLTIYQTDWDLVALRLQLKNGIIKQIPLVPLEKQSKNWIANFQIDNNNYYIVVSNLDGYVSLYDKDGQFLQQLELLDEISDFKLVDIIPRTGLQLKMDAGVPIIYLGFFFLMLSIIASSKEFPELWISNDKHNKNIYVAGRTNRSQLAFDLELFKIFANLKLK
jgi:cytochrome c biogenesis protein